MTKQGKKVTALSAAAVLAASAIVPVASAAPAAEAATISHVVFTTESGQLASLPMDKYNAALSAGAITAKPTHVQLSDGKAYTMEQYNSALSASAGSVEAATNLLAEKAKPTTAQVTEGKVSNGNVVTDETPSTEVKVESVKAINKTTVEVTFNQPLKEKVTADNFAIKGAQVAGVTMSEDNKTVTLKVEGLDYNTNYKVEVKDVANQPLVADFKTKSIEESWNLKINFDPAKGLVADGISTGVVKFELLNDEGKVDTKANDVVLDLNSTYGFLSQKRVTIQNGKAEVILRSEFMTDKVSAKIDAQIIEASNDYKDLIGKVFATTNVDLTPKGAEGSGETVLLKSVTSANSNQADRVTLTFDEEVGPNDFYTVVGNKPVLKNNITVSQKKDLTESKNVKGFLFDPNNKKVVTVVLNKDTFLADNQDVYVQAVMGAKGKEHKSSTQFKLADARIANITSVQEINNRSLDVTFSEAVHSADLVIDARFNKEHFVVSYGDLEFIDGRFVDNRHKATITLKDTYQEPDKDKNGNFIYPSGYFKPGKHALEASNIKDFAALSDKNNIGQTQVLEFNIQEDKVVAQIAQEVHSPEQFYFAFDKEVKFQTYPVDKDGKLDGEIKQSTFEKSLQIQVWDAEQENANGTKGGWVAVNGDYFKKAKVEKDFDWNTFFEFTPVTVKQGETEVVKGYKVETTVDWTEVYDTATTKNNHYNDQFRAVLAKGTVVTANNGKMNQEEISMPLSVINEQVTALGKPDITSPEIKANGIKRLTNENGKLTKQFVVEFTEPVKWKNGDDGDKADTAGQTLAQGQAALPDTKVEFIGKDAKGKVRTFTGKVVGYNENDPFDTSLIVEWETIDGETPQTVVDQEGNTNTTWKLVVKSISDDVGNTAPTASQDFELEQNVEAEVEGVFRVSPTAGSAVGEDGKTSTYGVMGYTIASEEDTKGYDAIEITYTEAVAITGLGSATNVKNYTLNGKDLPTGSSIALAPTRDGKAKADNKVVITLPEGTLNAKNVITLAAQIESKDGKKLEFDKAFTFDRYTKAQVEAIKKDVALSKIEDVKVVSQPTLGKTLVAFNKDKVTGLSENLALEFRDAQGNVTGIVALELKEVADKNVYSVVVDSKQYNNAASVFVVGR